MSDYAPDVFHRRKFFGNKPSHSMQVTAPDENQKVIGSGNQETSRNFRERIDPLGDLIKAQVFLRHEVDLDDARTSAFLSLTNSRLITAL